MRAARSRLVLLGLLAVFTAPLVLALVLYAGVGSWFEPGTVNRASLLDPPRPVPPERLVLANGESLPADYLDRRWTLVHLAASGCGNACEAALRAMRRAHRALGRNQGRVQRCCSSRPRHCCRPRRTTRWRGSLPPGIRSFAIRK